MLNIFKIVNEMPELYQCGDITNIYIGPAYMKAFFVCVPFAC